MAKKKKTIQSILNTIAQTIYDKKGFNILALDVREVSSLTDYVVIAEGNIDRHLKAIARAIQESLEEIEEHPFYVEGESTADWIVLDYSNIIIHLFIPELREKYSLEELWKAGSIVDVEIDTSRMSKE